MKKPSANTRTPFAKPGDSTIITSTTSTQPQRTAARFEARGPVFDCSLSRARRCIVSSHRALACSVVIASESSSSCESWYLVPTCGFGRADMALRSARRVASLDCDLRVVDVRTVRWDVTPMTPAGLRRLARLALARFGVAFSLRGAFFVGSLYTDLRLRSEALAAFSRLGGSHARPRFATHPHARTHTRSEKRRSSKAHVVHPKHIRQVTS